MEPIVSTLCQRNKCQRKSGQKEREGDASILTDLSNSCHVACADPVNAFGSKKVSSIAIQLCVSEFWHSIFFWTNSGENNGAKVSEHHSSDGHD